MLMALAMIYLGGVALLTKLTTHTPCSKRTRLFQANYIPYKIVSTKRKY
jgi:hypothetical protein